MIIDTMGASPSLAYQLKEAAEFYATILLHPKTAKKINLFIEIDKNLDDAGMCLNEDDKKNPRNFTISIRGDKDDDDPMQVLAHEMTHLAQHATNRLQTCIGARRANKQVEVFFERKWEGKVWVPKKNEDSYFDSPWEVEAFGKEVGLYHRWYEKYGKKY